MGNGGGGTLLALNTYWACVRTQTEALLQCAQQECQGSGFLDWGQSGRWGEGTSSSCTHPSGRGIWGDGPGLKHGAGPRAEAIDEF